MFWKKDLFGPFSPQVCLGVYSLMEKQGRFFRPAPAVGCSHPSKSSIGPAVSSHRFLCYCCCGVKAYDGAWKRINNSCNRPR